MASTSADSNPRLAGSSVLVTSAHTAVGRTTAMLFASEGADLTITFPTTSTTSTSSGRELQADLHTKHPVTKVLVVPTSSSLLFPSPLPSPSTSTGNAHAPVDEKAVAKNLVQRHLRHHSRLTTVVISYGFRPGPPLPPTPSLSSSGFFTPASSPGPARTTFDIPLPPLFALIEAFLSALSAPSLPQHILQPIPNPNQHHQHHPQTKPSIIINAAISTYPHPASHPSVYSSVRGSIINFCRAVGGHALTDMEAVVRVVDIGPIWESLLRSSTPASSTSFGERDGVGGEEEREGRTMCIPFTCILLPTASTGNAVTVMLPSQRALEDIQDEERVAREAERVNLTPLIDVISSPDIKKEEDLDTNLTRLVDAISSPDVVKKEEDMDTST